MKNIDIEFAHIYIDEVYNRKDYADIFERVKSLIKTHKDKTISLSVMIDDYNPDSKNLNVSEFLSQLKSEGLDPDCVVYESEIAKIAPRLFELMPESRLKRSYSRYVSKTNHFPCSFLIAAWYLLRLGKVDINGVSFVKRGLGACSPSDMIFNVIQGKYSDSEEKALGILEEILTKDEIKNKIFEILV